MTQTTVDGNKTDSRPTDSPKRGRPALEPTRIFPVRLPVSTIEIINRRAGKASMGPSVWLARVIRHEVVRRHYSTKANQKT